MAEAISEYRHQQRISSENEAIRRLIEAGLGKAPASAPSGGSTPGSTRKPAAGKTAAPRAKKPRSGHYASRARDWSCADHATRVSLHPLSQNRCRVSARFSLLVETNR